MTAARLSAARRAVAGSRRAAAAYFVGVLVCLAVASTWMSAGTVAYLGVIAYALPVPVTWPLLDAAFARYAREPVASPPARSRLHWVVCVLVGILMSMLVGAVGN